MSEEPNNHSGRRLMASIPAQVFPPKLREKRARLDDPSLPEDERKIIENELAHVLARILTDSMTTDLQRLIRAAGDAYLAYGTAPLVCTGGVFRTVDNQDPDAPIPKGPESPYEPEMQAVGIILCGRFSREDVRMLAKYVQQMLRESLPPGSKLESIDDDFDLYAGRDKEFKERAESEGEKGGSGHE